MKIKSKYHYFLAIAAVVTSGQLHAQINTIGDTVTATGPTVTVADDVTVQGTITVALPNAPAVSTGTPPVASVPIGNAQNTGFTNSGQLNTLYTYSTNGTGLQTQLVQTNGGVIAQTNGDLTLQQQKTQTNTATYTIEAREVKVSNPAGFTDTAGVYGPVGGVFVNGATLGAGVMPGPFTDTLGNYGPVGTVYVGGEVFPGTTNVATVRDGAGNLVSVISDLAGVGPVTATDGLGNPILTPTQVAAAVTAGAPASFYVPGPSVTTAGTGDLVVEGDADINGNVELGTIADVEQAILDNTTAIATEVTRATAAEGVLTTNLATEVTRATAAEGVLTTNLATEVTRATAAEGVLTTNLATEVTRATAAEGVLTTNLATEVADRILDVNTEEARALAAEGVLTTNLATEVTDRTNADLSIRNDFTAADTTERLARIAADTSIRNDYTAADTLERNARIAADDQIRSDYQSADRGLRSDIDQNTRGIAMVAAMTNTTVEAGKTHGVDFNIAQFQSETGMSFGYANRINENLQIHAAAASTTDFDEAVGRIGVSYQW